MSNARSFTPVPKNEPVFSYAPGSKEKAELKKALDQLKSKVTEVPLYINGQEIMTDSKDTVVCPHNHAHVLAKVSQASSEHAAMAVTSALEARESWAALPWEARVSVFLKASELIRTKYRYLINAATMLGQSKTCYQAEIDAACELIDFLNFNAHFAEKIYTEQPQSAQGMWNRSEARGLEGFVYAITPFNFTAIAVNLPAAPALMGCSVVWKPSPTSMLSSWLCMKVLEEAGLPKGVINMVPGDPKTVSSEVLTHPDMSGIHFTGSTATFNYLWKEVGTNIDKYKTYPRIVGETGGKDFVFAHPTANADEVTTALVRGAFEYQGQKCSAASRAYIPESLWAEVKGQLVETTKTITMGDVEDFSNFMSAVIDDRSFAKSKEHIDFAKNSSEAEIIVGGEYDDSVGYFVKPTVIVTTNPHYKSMEEEIFGPVLTVFVYKDSELDKTLKICDATSPYALTGAIFAKDRLAVDKMVKALSNAAGNFYVNDKPTGAVVGQQPFGGARKSGTNDKAGSVFNLLRWVSHRTIKETFTSITDYRYPFMDEK